LSKFRNTAHPEDKVCCVTKNYPLYLFGVKKDNLAEILSDQIKQELKATVANKWCIL